jgi:hypothetical protein
MRASAPWRKRLCRKAAIPDECPPPLARGRARRAGDEVGALTWQAPRSTDPPLEGEHPRNGAALVLPVLHVAAAALLFGSERCGRHVAWCAAEHQESSVAFAGNLLDAPENTAVVFAAQDLYRGADRDIRQGTLSASRQIDGIRPHGPPSPRRASAVPPDTARTTGCQAIPCRRLPLNALSESDRPEPVHHSDDCRASRMVRISAARSQERLDLLL